MLGQCASVFVGHQEAHRSRLNVIPLDRIYRDAEAPGSRSRESGPVTVPACGCNSNLARC
jgi:hypothetical protein